MRRHPSRSSTALLAAAFLLLPLSGCGSSAPDDAADAVPDRSSASSGEWSKEELGLDNGAESEPQLLTHGETAVIVTDSEDGSVAGHARVGDGPFEAGTATETGIEPLWFGAGAWFDGTWFALGNGGTEDVGDDTELMMDPVVMRSTDGRTWKAVEATGFSGPVEFQQARVIDGALVAVGARRSAEDPGGEDFVASAWRTNDGTTWKETRLPGATHNSFTEDLVVGAGRLIAVGGIDDHNTVWTSEDAGRTWAESTLEGVPAKATINHLAGEGDVLVASGTTKSGGTGDHEDDRSHVLYRSTDGGDTWQPASDPPPDEGEDYGFPVAGRSGRLFLTSSVFRESWEDPSLCYADIDLCRQDSEVGLYTSDDGDRWKRVDTSGFGLGEDGEIDTITALEDGTVIALRAGERTWTVGTWPGEVDLPTKAEPKLPTTDVDLLQDGESPKIGHRYAVPLHIHCGMDWLYLGDEPWQRTDDGPDVETGAGEAASADWPVAQQSIFGFATLVDEDTVEYSIGDGEIIATYGPPETDPVPCM